MSALPRAAWLALGALGAALTILAAESAGALLGDPGSRAALAGGVTMLVVLAAAAIALRRGRDRRSLALAAGAVAVLLRATVGVVTAPGGPPASLPADAVAWLARVESVGATSGGTQRAVVIARPDDATADVGGATPDLTPGPDGAVRLYLQAPRFPELVAGDVVHFTARAEAVPESGGFASYLRHLAVSGTARTEGVVVAGRLDDPLSHLARLRDALGDGLARVLPEPQAGLAAGIVVGLRERVGDDVAADFTAAGLSHIVAISGWNIALVGGAVAAACRGLARRPRSLVVVLAVCGYTVLAGAGPSVVRAAVMAGLVLFAREAGRPGGAAAMLGLAVGAMLAVDPTTVADPGFQLSAAATAGLLAWSAPMERLLERSTPRRTPRWLRETLAVSLAAQAATLPLVLLDFGRLSLVSPLANLLAAPLVTPVMAAGLVALAGAGLMAAGVPTLVLLPIEALAALVLGSLVALAHAAAALPFASVLLPSPVGWVAGLGALLGLAIAGTASGRRRLGRLMTSARRSPITRLLGAPRDSPQRSGSAEPRQARIGGTGRGRVRGRAPADRLLVAAAFLPLLALLLTGLALAGRADGRFHLTVLDVGQGDAILIVGDRGSRVLVDAGPDADRTLALLDARIPAWDRRLDLLVLTHPHEDHVGGMALLLQRYRIEDVMATPMHGPGPSYRAFEAALAEAGRTTRPASTGDRFRIDDAEVLVRWPPAGAVPIDPPSSGREINDASIVLDIRYGTRRFLLTGDAEDDVDPHLLAEGLGDGRQLDVLKVAHHGSRTATSAALLAALRPRLAVISVGEANTYGHPAPETLARLAAVGARTLRTDRDGSVEVSSDGTDLAVRASGGRPSTATTAGAAPTPWPAGAEGPVVSVLATIAPCPSPTGALLPARSWRSIPAPVSSLTPAPWRRSRPSSPPASRSVAVDWSGPWSRPPPSCTTWTSCCPATIPSACWATATARPAG